MERYILSLDQSTSASKAILFDSNLRIADKVAKEHKQYYPRPGWVEHDPLEIYDNVVEIIGQIANNNNNKKIEALAITNQRETIIVWNKFTGQPVYNAIVWQCSRGSGRCEKLINDGWSEKIKRKTGLIIDPYFSATGISWILENVPGTKEEAINGELLFGTIDSWLIWKLTKGKVHATDYTNACRTMLFNINTLKWDEEIFKELDIPMSMAPEVNYSNEIFGLSNANGILHESIPITGVLGDSHAALYGQMCFKPGMGKATYGTGSSIMMNIGDKPLESPSGLVTSVGYAIGGKVSYVFEGNIHSTGATVKWMQDELRLINDARETEALAEGVVSTEGVYLVPAFTGLGAPYWENDAKAVLCGMTRGTKKEHIVRAALESIAYQVKDLVDLMTHKAGIPLIELRVDGGPVNNNFLMQFQADILQSTINRCEIAEASALGVALTAGLTLNLWHDYDEITTLRSGDKLIQGKMSAEKASELYHGWKNAVKRTLFQPE